MSSRIFFAGEEQALQDFLSQQQYSQFILLADSCTNGFCVPLSRTVLPILSLAPLIVIPRGEVNKNLATCELIWQGLLNQIADRRTLLVTVGGGMVSDLGAFAASTYKRGIDVMHIPTTLLAMVDASHGGKTGLDFMQVKNMIGTFQQPKAIYIQPEFLETLDERVLRSGIAETIKHALVADGSWWAEMQEYTLDDFTRPKTISRSLKIKQAFCEQDPYDETTRQCLNFGHSIGHAIESRSMQGREPLLHGEAIMLGMYYEARLSSALLQLPKTVSGQVHQMIARFFPALTVQASYDSLEEFLRQDKKNDGHFRMSLLEQPGKCHHGVKVDEQQLRKIFSP